jgi:hypothetical protein
MLNLTEPTTPLIFMRNPVGLSYLLPTSDGEVLPILWYTYKDRFVTGKVIA